MIFTIDTDNNISAFDSAKDIQNTETTQQFNSEKALEALAAKWSTDRLKEIRNSLPGLDPVRSIKSRKTTIAFIWNKIQGLTAPAAPKKAKNKAKAEVVETPAPQKKAKAVKAAKVEAAEKPAKDGGKKATVIALLRRPTGASLAEIMEATSWLPHTVRGFISGSLVKKSGLKVESFKREDGQRGYAIREAK